MNCFNDSTDIVCNAGMRIGELRQFCKLQAEGVVLSRVEASEFDAGGEEIQSPHLAEALQYRPKLMMG